MKLPLAVISLSLFAPSVLGQVCISESVRQYLDCVLEECPTADAVCHGLAEDADTCDDVEAACQVITNDCCPECEDQLENMLGCVTGGACTFDCGRQAADEPTEAAEPTVAPTEAAEPTVAPTEAAEPTVAPTEAAEPTVAPTEAEEPTVAPTESAVETDPPTEALTEDPTDPPTGTDPPSGTEAADDAEETEAPSELDGETDAPSELDMNATGVPEAEGDICISEATVEYTECVVQKCPATADTCHDLNGDEDSCAGIEESCKILTAECCPQCEDELEVLLQCATPCEFDCGVTDEALPRDSACLKSVGVAALSAVAGALIL